MALGLALLFGLLALVGLLVGAAFVVTLARFRAAMLAVLIAFATGTLLGASLLELIPEAAAELSLEATGWLMLAALLGFFLLEKWMLWRHCHDPACEAHGHGAAGYLILVGDGIHNAVDGLALGAAFASDTGVGVAVGIAVLAHEIPQEVGDFALLLDGGVTRLRALVYNLLSGMTILPGIVTGFVLSETFTRVMGGALAVAAGGFLYVALADLVPELHRRGWAQVVRGQILPLLVGVLVMWLVGRLEA